MGFVSYSRNMHDKSAIEAKMTETSDADEQWNWRGCDVYSEQNHGYQKKLFRRTVCFRWAWN